MREYGRRTDRDRSAGSPKSAESYGGKTRRSAESYDGKSRKSTESYGARSYKSAGAESYGAKSRKSAESYGARSRKSTENRAGQAGYRKPDGGKFSGYRGMEGKAGSYYKEKAFRTGGYSREEEPAKPISDTEPAAYLSDLPEPVEQTGQIEGRNAVLEAFRSGRTIDRLLIQDGCQDGPVQTIKREARKQETLVEFVPKERLDHLSETGRHQGVIAFAAAYAYAEVEDILEAAHGKGEPPFLILLDGIEDPHNLGAIIRTANLAGAHGVIIPKRRAVGLTAAVARASAGALNYTPVARVTNLAQTIEELKKQGLWIACAAMDADSMYQAKLTGPIGLVIGGEGDGVSRLVREKCDFAVSIPMKGEIDSLNASVAAGVLAFEIVRQRENAME